MLLNGPSGLCTTCLHSAFLTYTSCTSQPPLEKNVCWSPGKKKCFRKIVRLSHDGRSKLKNNVWDRKENTILPEYSPARTLPIKLTNFHFFPIFASFFSGYRKSEHCIRLAVLRLHIRQSLGVKETVWLTWTLATPLPSIMLS